MGSLCLKVKSILEWVYWQCRKLKVKFTLNKKTRVSELIVLLNNAKKRFRPQLVVFHAYEQEVLSQKNANDSVGVQLPAFDNPFSYTSVRDLRKIYTGQDDYIGYAHLIYLISIFDVLLDTVTPDSCNSFLIKIGVEKNDIAELNLARQTRHCHAHKESKADSRWIKAYRKAKLQKSPIESGELVKKAFYRNGHYKLLQQIEDWQDLIIKISKIIYKMV